MLRGHVFNGLKVKKVSGFWRIQHELVLRLWRLLGLLGPHLWKKQHLLNARLVGQKHGQAVHSDAHARGRRHSVLEGAHKVQVDEHCLVVSLCAELELLFKAIKLFDGVVELRVGVCDLFAVDKQFEALGKAIVVAVTLAQGAT